MEYKNILIIRFRGIGDVLLSTPLVQALRRAYPRARIVYLTEVEAAEALRNNPDLDEVLVYPRDKTRRIPWREQVRRIWKLVKYITARRFDLSIDLRGDVKSVLFSLLSRAGERVGFEYRVRRWFYTTVARSSQFPPRLPAVAFNLKAAEALGIDTAGVGMVFQVTPKAQQYADSNLRTIEGGRKIPLIALNPGGTHPSKLWPLPKFIRLAERLKEKHRAQVVFFTGPYEQRLAASITGSLVLRPGTLEDLGAFLKRCRLFISNDGGPLHVAEALQVPTVGIFGGSDPAVWFPGGTGERGAVAGGWPRDIREVSVEEVLRCAEKLLSGKGPK